MEDTPTPELLKQGLEATRKLIHAEVALAKDELKAELTRAKHAAVWAGSGLCLTVLSIAMGLVAVILATPEPLTSAVIIAVVLLVSAAIAGVRAYFLFPNILLQRTRKRLEREAQVLRKQNT